MAVACQTLVGMRYSQVASPAGTLIVDSLHSGEKAVEKLLADQSVTLGGHPSRRKADAHPDHRL